VLKEQENVVFVEWKVSKLLLIMRCRWGSVTRKKLLHRNHYVYRWLQQWQIHNIIWPQNFAVVYFIYGKPST
jgi:hypothetical protein